MNLPDQFAASIRVVRLAMADWWRDWVTLAALNLVWMLCWLTVVLGPPATLVMSHVVGEFVAGGHLHARELPRLLVRYFLLAWLWMLPNLLVAGGVWLNAQFYAGLDAAWAVWLVFVSVLIGLGWLALQFYVLPVLMKQDALRLGRAYRNALFLMLASPAFSLVVLVVATVILVVSVRFPPLLFLGGPSLILVLGAHAVAQRLAAFDGVRRKGEDG